MAGKGAHLTSTLQSNASIFDFIAQQSLNDLLHPSAKKIAEFLYVKYPNTGFILRWFDECFLMSSAALQTYYLKKYGGSFSECFYGLQRVIASKKGGRSKLKNKHIIISLIALSLVPYLRRKLNTKAEELYFTDVPRSKRGQKEAIIRLNSIIQMSLQLAEFVQHLRYLSGQSKFNSPLLWFTGLRLVYSEEVDPPLSWRNFAQTLVQRSFELGAFFLQCYQYWQIENPRAFGTLPAPPPPELSQILSRNCPICCEVRNVDTVLAVSGHVFCFSCIQKYISREHKCPVTQLPATFQDLIRLYPNDC